MGLPERLKWWKAGIVLDNPPPVNAIPCPNGLSNREPPRVVSSHPAEAACPKTSGSPSSTPDSAPSAPAPSTTCSPWSGPGRACASSTWAAGPGELTADAHKRLAGAVHAGDRLLPRHAGEGGAAGRRRALLRPRRHRDVRGSARGPGSTSSSPTPRSTGFPITPRCSPGWSGCWPRGAARGAGPGQPDPRLPPAGQRAGAGGALRHGAQGLRAPPLGADAGGVRAAAQAARPRRGGVAAPGLRPRALRARRHRGVVPGNPAHRLREAAARRTSGTATSRPTGAGSWRPSPTSARTSTPTSGSSSRAGARGRCGSHQPDPGCLQTHPALRVRRQRISDTYARARPGTSRSKLRGKWCCCLAPPRPRHGGFSSPPRTRSVSGFSFGGARTRSRARRRRRTSAASRSSRAGATRASARRSRAARRPGPCRGT